MTKLTYTCNTCAFYRAIPLAQTYGWCSTQKQFTTSRCKHYVLNAERWLLVQAQLPGEDDADN